MYPLAALCAPCFFPPAGCRGHRREMWGHVPCLCGKLRRQGGKAQPRPSQAESDRAQALWPHVGPRLGRLQVWNFWGPRSVPGSWPAHPRPLPQESECCQVLQPVSPAGLGPGSPGQGTLSSVPPRPHGPRGPWPPPAPHTVLSAAALLRVCFCQAGPGTSRPRRCQGPSSQALGAPWVPSAARPRAQSSL